MALLIIIEFLQVNRFNSKAILSVDKERVIEVDGIRRVFRNKRGLEKTSFDCIEGDTVTLLGVNGAGKSTLLKLLTGNLWHFGGSIKLRRGTKIGVC